MTVNIRWDASDTTYISGPPSQRYVHFPLEVSASSPQTASVSVGAYDPQGNVIVQQTYEGLSVGLDWLKFSPALLVPDSYFVNSETWTLKALIYGGAFTIPKQITKQVQNSGGAAGGSRNMLFIVAGGLLLLLALDDKRFLK